MRALRNSCVVAFALVTLATGCSGPTTTPVSAEHISRYDVAMLLERDGVLRVRESIRYDFGKARRHGIFRDVPRRETYLARPGFDRLYRIDDVRVTADQAASAKTKRSTNGPYLHLRIGDPNKTVTGEHRYVISYRVRGASGTYAGHDELFWDPIGNQWPVPINRATVVVNVPADITKVGCTTGPPGSRLGCDRSRSLGRRADFAQVDLAREAGVTMAVAMPKGTIQPPPEPILDKRWTPGEGFARRANTLIPAGLIVLAGFGLMLVLAWTGRDRRFKGSAVDAAMGNATGDEGSTPFFAKHDEPVEFVPPAGIRPGQIGVLIDEDASVLDVTATIVDLAVRRYLKITEVPAEASAPTGRDYQLTKLAEPAQGLAALRPYESELLGALFRTGDVVKLSDLKHKFRADLAHVRDAMYANAVTEGWYRSSPRDVGALWVTLGAGLVVAGFVLTVLDLIQRWTVGLVGLAMVVCGLALVVGGFLAPSRTVKGSAALSRARGFRRLFEESDEGLRARFAEDHDIFSQYLPYAMVFGCTKKWARVFAGLDAAALGADTWYSGVDALDAELFGRMVDNFDTVATGTLYASAPSSSGESGFAEMASGGGGGGGGGGSW